ncbi:MAG: spore germination protein GerW family protein, partial [Bacillota bacterium]
GEGTGGGGGLGMRLVPNALAAIVDGELRVYSLGGRGALEKLVDLVPELVQKLGAQMGKGRTEEKTEEAS